MGWIVATTPQTAVGGEYVVLMDYRDNIILATLDHSLGSRMIGVGHATDVGDRVYEMIQRLILAPHNREQQMCRGDSQKCWNFKRSSECSAKDPYSQ